MKTFFSKTVVACSLAVASVFAVPAVQAATVFNNFTVTHKEGAVTKTFSANKIVGDYVEVITFNGGFFDVSLYFNAGQFVDVGGNGSYAAGFSRLGVDYGLYGLYKAKGTVTTGADFKTVFTFTPGSGSLNLFLDEDGDNIYNAGTSNPTDGTGDFVIAGSGNDIKIAEGVPMAGSGNLNPAGCGFTIGINCGSFGSTTSFALTNPAGTGFFTAPSPFYDLSFQSGQLNNFTPTGTVTINGSLDVVFSRAVPEPSSTALLGLGLLAVGFTARRRKQK